MNQVNHWLRSLQTGLGVWLLLWSSVFASPDNSNAKPAQIYLPIVASQRQSPGNGTVPTATPKSPKKTPTPTPLPPGNPTPTPTAGSVIPPSGPVNGIWISQAELASLPTSGTAWDLLKASADEPTGTPNLSNQDDDVNTRVMAKALVYARTGAQNYRDDVIGALQVVTYNHTEDGGRTLALGRELVAYIIAADLIDLQHVQPDLDSAFRQKLRELLDKNLDGDTLRSTHELRPNNWGTHAGASRAAIAVYLGDKAELERTAQVFHGYLGNRAAYAGFNFADDLSWQADPGNPVSINPVGATKEGHSIDGALPEEMRRGGTFQWPPADTNYPWEGMQGAIVQAEILYRAGYPTWEWENKALLRAANFLYGIGWSASNDDKWQPWLLNARYGTSFPTDPTAHSGKNMGWTNWTHQK